MAEIIFNFHSLRAQQARLGTALGGWPVRLLRLSVFLCIVLGAVLLYVGSPMGWLVASLAVFPMIVSVWHRRFLRVLPVAPGESMDARLEGELLGQLPDQITSKILARALGRTHGGHFMAARFGVAPSFVESMLVDSEDQIERMWRLASQLEPTGMVSSAVVLAAFTQTQENVKQVLPHLQLDETDLMSGAQWYKHLNELIERDARPQRTGGIARDWTFGYTPMLSHFGVNVSDQVTRGRMYNTSLEAHQSALDFLVQTFSGGGKQNAALVGPLGSGKTTVVAAFASLLMSGESKISGNLKFRQVVSLDAGALISAAAGRGELEQLINQLLMEAYKAKNIILCLDDAQLFFEEGVGSVDLSNILLPVLQGGGLRMILTMEEQRYLQIAARNPALAAALNRITVSQANQSETIAVLEDQLIRMEFQYKVTYMFQALKEAYRLSERYLYDQAQPGKAIRLLESAARYPEQGLITATSVRQAIEQTQGVKVGANTTESERDKLLNLEQLIHERMINQTRAVTVVSDALRRARAGVRNESRPIGTFLFLGPTGVGKTELAKSLAEVYFGGEDRLIRLDMNEFVGPNDVRRLIADGADDPHSLSAQVMKQPFSVILLDELEKAHDTVLTTLLQVLDEGILRDIKGREVSFRDAIFIATSNAGADHIRHHIEAGEELEQFENALTDELINSGQFRPEFLNRFDEIVLFRSLKPQELMQVVDLMIAGINKTLGPQKISVTVDDQLKQWLVMTGNDPRLGARPMRRIVQRVVENTMAKRMLAGEVQPGQTVQLTIADVPVEFQAAQQR